MLVDVTQGNIIRLLPPILLRKRKLTHSWEFSCVHNIATASIIKKYKAKEAAILAASLAFKIVIT